MISQTELDVLDGIKRLKEMLTMEGLDDNERELVRLLLINAERRLLTIRKLGI